MSLTFIEKELNNLEAENPVLIAALIAGAIAFFYTLKSGTAEVLKQSEGSLDDLYKKHGALKGVDWRLLKAIAMVESTENPQAVNPADPSVGLFQILCVPDGNGGCSNKFNIRDWPPDCEADLFNPDLNAHYGSQILAWNVNTYGLTKGVAVYNRWASRKDEPGQFGNQDYVNKVLGNYVSLGGVIDG